MQTCNNNLKVESSANGMTNFSALVASTLLLLVMAITIASRIVISLCRTELTGYPCLIFVISFNYDIFGTKSFTPKNTLKKLKCALLIWKFYTWQNKLHVCRPWHPRQIWGRSIPWQGTLSLSLISWWLWWWMIRIIMPWFVNEL